MPCNHLLLLKPLASTKQMHALPLWCCDCWHCHCRQKKLFLSETLLPLSLLHLLLLHQPSSGGQVPGAADRRLQRPSCQAGDPLFVRIILIFILRGKAHTRPFFLKKFPHFCVLADCLRILWYCCSAASGHRFTKGWLQIASERPMLPPISRTPSPGLHAGTPARHESVTSGGNKGASEVQIHHLFSWGDRRHWEASEYSSSSHLRPVQIFSFGPV